MPFKPPAASKKLLEGVPFDRAVDTLPEARPRFDDFDQTPAGKKDPNLCKALLKFPDGTIFWSSKMAVDADGAASAPGRPRGKELDPGSGTNQTSFRFADGKSLSSEAHHYVVIPLKPGSDTESFHPDIGKGDVAIVIYKDKITAAICGDMGPPKRIGEGSIRVHEDFHPPAPDPCKKRDVNEGFCLRILNASIEEDVLFFVFPNSDFGNVLTPSEIETKVKERAFTRYNELRGIS
jgi:hypothetical protein